MKKFLVIEFLSENGRPNFKFVQGESLIDIFKRFANDQYEEILENEEAHNIEDIKWENVADNITYEEDFQMTYQDPYGDNEFLIIKQFDNIEDLNETFELYGQ